MSTGPKLNTHMTIVIVAFLTLLGLLSWQGKDTAAVIMIGGILLGGMGFTIAQGQQVKDQTNGNTSQLVERLTESIRMLAVAHPIPADVVHEIANTPSTPGKSVSGPPAEPVSPPRPPDPAWAGPVGTYPTVPSATDATLSTRP